MLLQTSSSSFCGDTHNEQGGGRDSIWPPVASERHHGKPLS